MTHSRMTNKRFPVDVGKKLGAYNDIDLVNQEGRGVESNGLVGTMFITTGDDEVIEFIK